MAIPLKVPNERHHRLYGHRRFHLRTIHLHVPVVHETIHEPLFAGVFASEYRFVLLVDCIQPNEVRYAVAGPRIF